MNEMDVRFGMWRTYSIIIILTPEWMTQITKAQPSNVLIDLCFLITLRPPT